MVGEITKLTWAMFILGCIMGVGWATAVIFVLRKWDPR